MQRTDPTSGVTRLAIVGAGRLGTAIATALRSRPATALHSQPATALRSRAATALRSRADTRTGGFQLIGLLGRDAAGLAQDPVLSDGNAVLSDADAVLLCVPDREISTVAAALPRGPLVGHCSGATGLEPLAPHEAFSMHPLMTVSAGGADFAGATAAIDATSERALGVATALARALEMDVVRVRPEDRSAYHAAASIASNFLVTLEAAAERLGATAGVSRAMLAPLVRASVENWATLGPGRALTGPVARGDQQTVARQRAAVAERTPELIPLFDALTDATRTLAGPAPTALAGVNAR